MVGGSNPPGRMRAVGARVRSRRARVVGLESFDRLVDELWGERPPGTAAKVLQGYVSRLHKLLPPGLLETREPGYLIHLEVDQLDLRLFERLRGDAAAEAAAGRWHDAVGGRPPACGEARLSPMLPKGSRVRWHGSTRCAWPRSRNVSLPTWSSGGRHSSCRSWSV